MAERGAAIKAHGLAKSFGGKAVFAGVDLTFAPGDFVSIVGKSGCGKSTLLRLLIGLESPSAGQIETDAGGDARLMFQEPRLLPWASVAENVIVGLSGEAGAGAEAKALETLGKVGLQDKAGEWPSRLSGGQRQRVALARALVSRPRLLALDEPLGALDALTRIEMQALLEGVWREQGFTALLVTHDVPEAVALADRVILLADGGVALDQAIDLPRPRRRGDPAFAQYEGLILDKLLGG